MAQFFIDKANKVPIYLQLKDQIKYFVATGALSASEQLPPVRALAEKLSINFLTVRKAYQELQSEGLVDIRHGEGTFLALSHDKRPNSTVLADSSADDIENKMRMAIDDVIARYEGMGVAVGKAATCVEGVLETLRQRSSRPTVVFTECNQFQITEISSLLEAQLGIEVLAIMVDKLAESVPALIEKGRRMHVITTGFHVTEVRDAVGDLPAEVSVLITNLNPDTRRKLESIGEKGKFSFICRDRESTLMYRDLLKAELGFAEIDMTSCTIYEPKKVQEALRTSDAVLASPPVYDAVRRMAPKGVSVYNLFERVDPMSLKVIKDRILSAGI